MGNDSIGPPSVNRKIAVAVASTITALSVLGTAAVFTIKNASGIDIFRCHTATGCALTVPLSYNGADLGSGATLRYPTFPLTGSGVATSTGVNVWGDYYVPYNMTVKAVGARLSQTANNNATTVLILKNGQSILSTNITIDSGENDTSTAATAAVINSASGSFVKGDRLTFNVNSPASTPGKDLKVRLIWQQTSFPMTF